VRSGIGGVPGTDRSIRGGPGAAGWSDGWPAGPRTGSRPPLARWSAVWISPQAA